MIKKQINDAISGMSLEEKITLLTGKDSFNTANLDRLNIPSLQLSDGPHGVRKIISDYPYSSIEATCFPTSSALAATWNLELVEEVGEALGKECIANDIDVLLGPGANIKRSPLCGRNFEYFSEDPILSGELAAAYIKGVQKTGVATSLKHFAANNIEFCRMTASSEVDDRTMREIYLKPFEIAVKKSAPKTVMCAYNRLNGIYCSENHWLLWDILRKEWEYSGIVMSDWGAVHNRVEAAKASLELEMPYSGGKSFNELKDAVISGYLRESEIDTILERLLNAIFEVKNSERISVDNNILEQNNNIAEKAALEAITLLRNENDMLPISKSKTKRITVIGKLAVCPHIQGEGSSKVNNHKSVSPLDAIKNLCTPDIEVTYFDISPRDKTLNSSVFFEAREDAAKSDLALMFLGLADGEESEMFDRTTLEISQSDLEILRILIESNIKVVAIVMSGAPVVLSNLVKQPDAVIHTWLAGQGVGKALSDILFGCVSPSGKLPETFPKRLEDCPSYNNSFSDPMKSVYSETIYVGYRHFDYRNIEPLYPFGHGLSYAVFEYSDLKISASSINDKQTVEVRFQLKNTGGMEAKETVQLYVGDKISYVSRPLQELKHFTKVLLKPGEVKEISFLLGEMDFAYYNPCISDWCVETGEFDVRIGASSRDIRLRTTIFVKSSFNFS